MGQLVYAIVGAGGAVGAIYGLLKLRPERESIIVTAARGAVVIQETVLDDVRAELDRLGRRVDEYKADVERYRQRVAALEHELLETRAELVQTRAQRDAALAAAAEMRARMVALEERIRHIEETTDGP